MQPDLQSVFIRLRDILQRHAGTLRIARDTPACYSLEGETGPATLHAWGGKMKRRTIPVAWVQIGKAYVSYHLMGVYGNASLSAGMSKELKARMQGKTCFNFKTCDDALFGELERLTGQTIRSFRKVGFIT